MRIINPIYDVAFKYLMEDMDIARSLIGEIIGEDIHSLVVQPQEMSSKSKKEGLQDQLKTIDKKLKAKDKELKLKDKELKAKNKELKLKEKELKTKEKEVYKKRQIVEELKNNLIKK